MKLEKLFFATVLSGLAFTACVDNDDKSEFLDGSLYYCRQHRSDPKHRI